MEIGERCTIYMYMCIVHTTYVYTVCYACVNDRYTSTFRAGSIGHRRCCWDCRTILPSTCGASAVSWWRCTPVNHCLPAPMRYTHALGLFYHL